MKKILPALIALFSLAVGYSQDKADLAEALVAAFKQPDMQQQLETGWQGVSILYFHHSPVSEASPSTFTRLFKALEEKDLGAFPKPVHLTVAEKEKSLPSESGAFLIHGTFRGSRLSLSAVATLPDNPRQRLTASFILEEQSGRWQVLQEHVHLSQ